MRLDEAREERSEAELLDLLKTTIRRAHDIAKRTPIFACFSSSAPNYFLQETSKLSSHFVIDKALEDFKMSTRSRASVIGFTNAALAQREQDGELYVILPTDKASVWVAPEDDFYKSFKHANKKLRIEKVSNSSLATAFEFLGEYETWPQLRNLLEKPEVQRFKGDDHAARLASFKDYPTGISWFRALFDLEDNGFERFLPSAPLPVKREVWVDGSCIAINAEKYDELHKRGLVK